MIRVQLLFFAVLRDIAGTDQQPLTLPEGSRARDVWAQLRRQFPRLERYEALPMTAINEAYAAPDTVLNDGDRLAFIPPVSGG
jgi:molybdopterin converting factor subunit 1